MASRKINISWNGLIGSFGGKNAYLGDQGQEPSIVWNDNPYVWGDISIAQIYIDLELDDNMDDEFSGRGSAARRERERQRQLNKQLTDDQKRRIIKLVSHIKGERIVQTKQAGDIKVNINDVKLVVEDLFKTLKLERETEDGDILEVTSYVEEETNDVV